MSDFKQCPNGHYYQGDHCPYCKPSAGAAVNNNTMKTEVFGNQETLSHSATEVATSVGAGMGGAKTQVIDGGGAPMGVPNMRPQQSVGSAPMSSRTMFGDMDDMTPGTGGGAERLP